MKYISVEQAAQKWGINRKTVSDYCKNGVIKCTKQSGRWLIPENEAKPVLGQKKTFARNFTFIDLFCGIGGFHQAMTALGGKCVFACDINEMCRRVYKDNFIKSNEFELLDDINKVVLDDNLPPFDVLCGGFPCQTFSKAGKRNGFAIVESDDGTKDERGQLFFRIIDILRNHQECNYVILENVRNLADNKDNWNVVCSELKQLGFIITEDPIIESPHHFGIPQVRDKLSILLQRKGLSPSVDVIWMRDGRASEHDVDCGHIPNYSVGRRPKDLDQPPIYLGDDYQFVREGKMQLQVHLIYDRLTKIESPALAFYIPKTVIEKLTNLVIQAN